MNIALALLILPILSSISLFSFQRFTVLSDHPCQRQNISFSSCEIMETVLNLKQWYPSPDRVVSPRPWFLPLTQLAFIGLTMLPRKSRIAIAVPALLLLVRQTRAASTGDNVKDFGRASFVFGFVLKFIDFGILTRDGEVYKIKSRKIAKHGEGEVVGESRSTGEASFEDKRSIWKRFKDSAELWLFTMRGIGWNWEVGGIPHREPQSTGYVPAHTKDT